MIESEPDHYRFVIVSLSLSFRYRLFRFVSFRFVSFRFVSFRFVSLRFVDAGTSCELDRSLVNRQKSEFSIPNERYFTCSGGKIQANTTVRYTPQYSL